MSLATIAAKEGLPSNEIEIINVEERRVDENTVEVVTTYRIKASGMKRMFRDFLELNNVSDVRIMLALKCDLIRVIAEGWVNDGVSYRAILNQVWQSTVRTYSPKSFEDPIPPWFFRRQWSPPVNLNSLDLKAIPNTQGVYAFAPQGIPALIPGAVLYVGAAGVRGADRGLRDRIAEYMPVILNGKKSKHSGARLLSAWGPELCLHWAPCHFSIVDDIEGGLIDLLMPYFNNRDERGPLPDDYDEDLDIE